MNRIVSDEKLQKYFDITKEALSAAKCAPVNDKEKAHTAIDMAQRYYNDALHFKNNGDIVLAFAALNYAHGWLDCAARSEFFVVKDNRLFTVEGE